MERNEQYFNGLWKDHNDNVFRTAVMPGDWPVVKLGLDKNRRTVKELMTCRVVIDTVSGEEIIGFQIGTGHVISIFPVPGMHALIEGWISYGDRTSYFMSLWI